MLEMDEDLDFFSSELPNLWGFKDEVVEWAVVSILGPW